jgi:MYXO-CTERM domain-containing protein
MKRLASALLALPLLLALAAPVAAVDPTPEPAPYGETPACPPIEIVDGVYVIPKDAPEGCMYIQGGGDPSVMPAPIDCDPALGCETLIAPMPIAEPLPCDPEIVAAAGSENPLIAPAPCLLPDGTLYELAGRGTQPNERGEELPDYESFLEEFKKELPACAEGTDPNTVDITDMNFQTCLLADGTTVGPIPLFAMPTTDGGIAESGEVEESSGSLLPIVAIVALVGAGGLLLIRRRAA